MTRVLLVDDQALVRMGFRLVLESAGDIDVVGEAGDGKAAFDQVGPLRPEVVVMDVYVAREDPEPGVDGKLVAGHVPLPDDKVAFVPSWSATPAALVERALPGDLVLTLGAGDVTDLAPAVLALLAERADA